MAKCPNCNTKIPLIKFFKLDYLKPIECKNCQYNMSIQMSSSRIVSGVLFVLVALPVAFMDDIGLMKTWVMFSIVPALIIYTFFVKME